MSPHFPQIIAHRGASFDAPENTLAAVRLAWHQNADAVEIDIHFSKDGRIVVMHDDTTTRTTGSEGRICEQNFEALRLLDTGAGERIPELAEVIATVPLGKRLFTEIKCGPEVIAALEHSLKASGKPLSQFVVICFSYETLLKVKEALPQLELFWLVGTPAQENEDEILTELAGLSERAVAAGLEGLNLHFEYVIHKSGVDLVQSAGLKCYAWTVDSPDEALRLKDNGIDGITTNRPGLLQDLFEV